MIWRIFQPFFSIFLVVLYLGYSLPTWAQETTASGKKRPTIAVVFAGGGAKGAAHVGVLKELERMRIPVDIVTGTSMGAYVGALYAMGMSPEQIEKSMTSVDWNTGYRDRVERSEKRLREKAYDDKYQIQADLGLNREGFSVPKGVVQGQNMLQLIRQTSGNPSEFKSFDDLAVRYRAVATDVVNLKPVVLDKGSLVDVMMASMSVPGALPPYEYQNMLLVDGGVTNNMPVDVARSLGADIIIAIDISTNYKTKEQLTTLLSVADQLSNYMVRRSTQEQTEKLLNQDILIKPAVGSMETTDFVDMPKALKLGQEAAVAHKSQLSRYRVSKADYQAYVDAKQQVYASIKQKKRRKIASVTIKNN
ncbi:MAG: patatin-like phospholipase family protein, partial [Vibrio sp.]